jgi:TRAP-type transport system periplasmic protein
MKLLAHGAVAAAFVAALAVTSAEARELRLGPGAPPAHPAYDPMYLSFQKFLPEDSGGALTGVLMGLEVANIGNMKDSLQSQLVEVGNVLPLYNHADLPNSALIGDLAFLGKNPHAMAAAMTEYVATCADCQAEFKAAGMVYTGSGSSDVYVLLTTKKVETLDDMKGLRLRSGGAPYSRFAEAMGAEPVAVPVSDTFEQISQGVIDGTMASINDLVAYRLVDLVKYVTEIPLGTYHCTSNFTVSAATWGELSVDERKALVVSATKAGALFTQSWGFERPGSARKAAEDAGIEFVKPADDFVAARNDFAANDPANVAKAATDSGITDADAKIARFVELVAKWDAIAEAAGSDPMAIAAKMQAEIWDQVDYSSYGL